MPQRIYNNFTPWIKQDNYLTGWPSFIDSKNMDGLVEGIGITLWPKVTKVVLTDTTPMRSMDARQTSDIDLDETFIGWDWGNIYKFNSTDNTPAFTLANWNNIIKTVLLWNYLFFFYKSSLASTSYWMARISRNDAESNNWVAIDENFKTEWTFNAIWCPPVLVVGSEMYFGNASWQIATMDSAWTVATYSFPDGHVMGITLQWSTIAVYSNSGNVYFWDGAATLPSGRWVLWARSQKAVTLDWRDYITTEDGQFKTGSYTSFQKITEPNYSFRLEDNSVLWTKLNFIDNDIDAHQDHTMRVAKDNIYVYNSDTVPWIYKYGNLVAWTAKGLHKVITQNHAGTQIDLIYDMYYYERTARRLYFSYKAGTTYWIDSINLDDLLTCSDWYAITEVFTGWTAFLKQLNVARITVSNVDANNTASLYYRVNNQAWELLRTINSTKDDGYYRENIYSDINGIAFKQFVDVQFKIELHSDDNDNTPPTLNEFMFDYTITNA